MSIVHRRYTWRDQVWITCDEVEAEVVFWLNQPIFHMQHQNGSAHHFGAYFSLDALMRADLHNHRGLHRAPHELVSYVLQQTCPMEE